MKKIDKNIDIIKSEQSHITVLHSKIKPRDIDEVYASHGITAEEALVISLKGSCEAYTVMINNSPEMMFGVAKDLEDGVAVIWMLSSEQLFKLVGVKRFVKETKIFVKHFHEQFEYLYNYVDERNLTSLAWLRRVGFKLADREPEFGFLGLPFIKIISKRK
jgi:hypothetical protein